MLHFKRYTPLPIAALLLAIDTVTAMGSVLWATVSATGECGDVQGVQPFVPFYIHGDAALFGDAAANGITGAEFRIDGVDPAWFTQVTASPTAATFVGDPAQGGCAVTFANCQAASNVRLCTILCIALGPVLPRQVMARAHSNPSDPMFDCPSLLLCDAPVATRLCMRGCGSCINQSCNSFCHDPLMLCEGVLPVKASTWSSVKGLYSTP